jgi:hypothetical protein
VLEVVCWRLCVGGCVLEVVWLEVVCWHRHRGTDHIQHWMLLSIDVFASLFIQC